MASVTSTSVNKQRTLPNGNVDIQYRFDLLDNFNQNHVEYFWRRDVPPTHDTDADMVALAPIILQQKADVEYSGIKSQIEQGMEPFFNGTLENTFAWDEHSTYFVQACKEYWAVENFLDILNFRLVWSAATVAIGSTGLKTLFGITQKQLGDLNGDMQNAVNVQNMIDAYAPHYDPNTGVWA